MTTFSSDPPLSAAIKGESFFQTIRLFSGDLPIALARWQSATSPAEGVVQLIELTVKPPLRRQGHAGRLLKEVIAQAAEYHRSRRSKLRRIWTAIEQKQQIIARAFLTSHGFYHIATASDLLRDQDLMIYSKAFD